MFRSRDAVAAEVSWRDLYTLRDQGEILELSRGLYQLADAAGMSNVDFVAVCGRAPRGMICLNSALAYRDLSDEIPAQVDLAVPSGSHRPVIDYPRHETPARSVMMQVPDVPEVTTLARTIEIWWPQPEWWPRAHSRPTPP